MVATVGTCEEIRVAIGKLKSELAELAKIKTVTLTKADKLKLAPAHQAQPAPKADPKA